MIYLAFAAFLAFTGAAIVARGAPIIERVGFPRSVHPAVFGGRYLAMAAILAVLVLLGEWRAVAVVLGAGAAMGIFDAVMAVKGGGSARNHAVATVFCVAGAWGALALRT
jgi:hypothetical protein